VTLASKRSQRSSKELFFLFSKTFSAVFTRIEFRQAIDEHSFGLFNWSVLVFNWFRSSSVTLFTEESWFAITSKIFEVFIVVTLSSVFAWIVEARDLVLTSFSGSIWCARTVEIGEVGGCDTVS